MFKFLISEKNKIMLKTKKTIKKISLCPDHNIIIYIKKHNSYTKKYVSPLQKSLILRKKISQKCIVIKSLRQINL
jgi:hypothetical protein